jgi:hypothetical protein
LHRTHKIMRVRLEALKAKREKQQAHCCSVGLCLCP